MEQRFLEIYNSVVDFKHIDNKDQHNITLNDPCIGSRCCRFCQKFEPEVSFKNIAHAISENAGNKILLSNYECDKCNTAFGEHFEDSFGKYIFPFKIISQVFGKSNKLRFKNNQSGIEIRKSSAVLSDLYPNVKALIVDRGEMYTINMNEDGCGFTMRLNRQGYHPQYVYLALLKMAYSIMPFSYIPRFIHSLIGLQMAIPDKDGKEEKVQIMASYPYIGYEGFTPGLTDTGVSATLYSKKENAEEKYPACIFILSIGNFNLQIPVPEDSHLGKLSLPPYLACEQSTISEINFHNEEKTFSCEFSGNIEEIKLSADVKEKLSKELHTKKFL